MSEKALFSTYQWRNTIICKIVFFFYRAANITIYLNTAYTIACEIFFFFFLLILLFYIFFSISSGLIGALCMHIYYTSLNDAPPLYAKLYLLHDILSLRLIIFTRLLINVGSIKSNQSIHHCFHVTLWIFNVSQLGLNKRFSLEETANSRQCYELNSKFISNYS